MNVYEKINDFCKARNVGSIYKNERTPTPRVKFITELLKELKLKHKVERFKVGKTYGFNIIIYPSVKKKGKLRILTAHHDIVNPNVDNANDNSCSVINAIATRVLCPEIMVVLTDGEEVGGLGARHLSEQIIKGDYGKVLYVLNLELTGKGGKNFFVGMCKGKLKSDIVRKFKCPIVRVPFNDSVIMRQYGIDSVVINPLPLKDGALDMSLLYNCHTVRDTLATISTTDMKEFVEEVIVPILKESRK